MKYCMFNNLIIVITIIAIMFALITQTNQIKQLQDQLIQMESKMGTVEEVFDQAGIIKNRINRVNPKANKMEIAYAIMYVANKYQVDHLQIAAQAEVESAYCVDAIGKQGEKGLLQVMPTTFAEHGRGNIDNWFDTLDAGAAYVAWLRKYYGDTVLASYNAGPNRARKQQIARGYIAKVSRRMTALELGGVKNATSFK